MSDHVANFQAGASALQKRGGWRIAEIARAAGLTYTPVYRILKGEKAGSEGTRRKIAKALDVSTMGG